MTHLKINVKNVSANNYRPIKSMYDKRRIILHVQCTCYLFKYASSFGKPFYKSPYLSLDITAETLSLNNQRYINSSIITEKQMLTHFKIVSFHTVH